MSQTQIDWRQRDAEKYFISDIKKIIASACGCSGQNYKLKVTLQELIDYKFKDSRQMRYLTPNEAENELFKLYVSVIDNVIGLTKAYWPFIDLTGIDLAWTPRQIIDAALAAYRNVPVMTLNDIQKYYKRS